jgi:hypothetical protein
MRNNEASKLKAEKLSSLYLDAVRVAFQPLNLAVERLGFESLVDEIINGAISDLKRNVAHVENCF